MPCPSLQTTLTRRRGLSLPEVVVSTMLVGIVVVGSLNSIGGVTRTWRESASTRSRQGLAQQLMYEVLACHYEEPVDTPTMGIESPESPADRSLYDDVDDYHGWSSPPESKDGTVLPGYSGWTRTVAVEWMDLDQPTLASGSDMGLKRVTVTVTDAQGEQTKLVGYRSRWGVLEQVLQADTTVQTWVGLDATIGAGGRKLQSGIGLLNHAVDQAP